MISVYVLIVLITIYGSSILRRRFMSLLPLKYHERLSLFSLLYGLYSFVRIGQGCSRLIEIDSKRKKLAKKNNAHPPRPGFEPGSRPFERHPEGCDLRMLPLHHLGLIFPNGNIQIPRYSPVSPHVDYDTKVKLLRTSNSNSEELPRNIHCLIYSKSQCHVLGTGVFPTGYSKYRLVVLPQNILRLDMRNF